MYLVVVQLVLLELAMRTPASSFHMINRASHCQAKLLKV